MRQTLLLIACLVLMSSLGRAVKADPIVATAYLTIGSDSYIGNQTWSGSSTIANPSDPQIGTVFASDVNQRIDIPIDSSLIPNLSSQGTTTYPYGLIHDIQTTYDLRIYFGPSLTPDVGSQQPNPYVEITGNITGFIGGVPKGEEMSLATTSMSLTVKNNQLTFGIPRVCSTSSPAEQIIRLGRPTNSQFQVVRKPSSWFNSNTRYPSRRHGSPSWSCLGEGRSVIAINAQEGRRLAVSEARHSILDLRRASSERIK